jgi:hypothetical protein
MTRALRAVSNDQIVEQWVTVHARTQRDDVPQPWKRRTYLLDYRHQAVIDDQNLRVAVGDEILIVRRFEIGIDRQSHRADFHDAEHQRWKVDAVHGAEQHALTGFHV